MGGAKGVGGREGHLSGNGAHHSSHIYLYIPTRIPHLQRKSRRKNQGNGTTHGGRPECRGWGSKRGTKNVTGTAPACGGAKKVGGTTQASGANQAPGGQGISAAIGKPICARTWVRILSARFRFCMVLASPCMVLSTERVCLGLSVCLYVCLV